MKQLLQDLKNGETRLADVPAPQCPPGHILIRTRRTLISPGTERMLLEFGRANLLQKARSQPERVRQVIAKMRTDGVLATVDAVRAKLDEAIPLGYCNAGVVIECGDQAARRRFPEGTRVASNGAHAEAALAGVNLGARIPDPVSDEEAAFTVLGAVALQGVRLAAPALGETVFVIGLGLTGLLTVQLLKANGCQVLASDFQPERLALARELGAETVDLSAGRDPVAAAEAATSGRGADAVLICAASDSNDPIRQAAAMCRVRGRVVLVGVVGLQLDRDPFFKKEITFQVSKSYGPGRYDEAYESGQYDLPAGYVRWSAQRNFEAFLQLLAEKKIDVTPLISQRVPYRQAAGHYSELLSGDPLAVVLEYGEAPIVRETAISASRPMVTGRPTIAVIGPGSFCRRVILPTLAKLDFNHAVIAGSRGVTAAETARKFGFARAVTETASVFADASIDVVVIATRHNRHGEQVLQAIEAGKHVFVEKPLCIQLEELQAIWKGVQERDSPPVVQVGFNRRFAPLIQQIQSEFAGERAPFTMIYTVNAGAVAAESWIQNPDVGGGRILGEVCHFLDTLQFLAGARWDAVQAAGVSNSPDGLNEDKIAITIEYSNGSLGVINYFANGPKSLAKERLTVMAGGRAAELENYLALRLHRANGVKTLKRLRQDKGHRAQFQHFRAALAGEAQPVSLQQAVEVTLAAFAVQKAYQTGERQTWRHWSEQLWGATAQD